MPERFVSCPIDEHTCSHLNCIDDTDYCQTQVAVVIAKLVGYLRQYAPDKNMPVILANYDFDDLAKRLNIDPDMLKLCIENQVADRLSDMGK